MADRVIAAGILTPHDAVGPEEEFPAMAPGRITTRVARIAPRDGGTAPTSPPGLRALMTAEHLDDAAGLLAGELVDVVGYASTSSGYAAGFAEEAAMVAGLSRRIRRPVAATCASAVLALRLLGAGRIALVHPPWFGDELNELGAAYFASQGFEVVASASAGLPRDPRLIEPAGVVEWASGHVPDGADAIFIGGNGFRAAAAIEPLELAVGRPVLESNQVLLWNLLAQAGAAGGIQGYGQLFAKEPPAGGS